MKLLTNKKLFFGLIGLVFCLTLLVPGAESIAGAAGNSNAGNAVTPPSTVSVSGVAELLYGLFIRIGGAVAWVGGYLLDFSIENYVIGMGSLLLGNFGVAINNAWVVIRDVFNLIFIFALIWIGLKTILKADDSGTKKQLGLLIVAALLINFSLLATKTIVDFSNIAATEIYKQITVVPAPGATLENKSISSAFMEQLRLNSYANRAALEVIENEPGFSSGRLIIFGFLMMLFMMIAGVIFFAGGILLIVRFVTLIFFMVFSPFMLAGLILPAMSGLMKKWWERFISNAFVAPAYIFMLFLSLSILQGMSSGDKFSQAFTNGSYGTFGIIGQFFLMTGFMYGSLVVAQKMGAAGATATLNTVNKIGNTVRGGVQGFAYRNTAGLTFGGARNLWDRMDRAAEQGSTTAKVTRTLLGGESTRRGINAARNYGAGGLGREQVETQQRERRQRATRSNTIANIEERITTATNAPGGADLVALTSALSDASGTQLVEMAKTKSGRDLILQHAGRLSENQAKAITDSTDLDDSLKSEFRSNHDTQLRDNTLASFRDPARLTAGHPQAANANESVNLRNAGKNQLEAIGVDRLSEPAIAVRLSANNMKDIDKLRDENKITPAQAQAIRTARETALIAASGNVDIAGSTIDQAVLSGLRSDEKASLPDDALINIAGELTIGDLKVIQANNNKDIVKQRLRTAILGMNAAGNNRLLAVQGWLNDPNRSSEGSTFGR